MQLDQLREILEKNPTIYTYSAKEIIAEPEKVDTNYLHHVKTHISLPDLEPYVERMLTVLLTNHTGFAGGLFGDYGLGKTSTSIYLWRRCEEQGILAVPPYQWEKFPENFDVLYSWAKYRIGRVKPQLVTQLDGMIERYREPALDAMAKEIADTNGISYDQAMDILKAQQDKGQLNLSLNETDYLDFMADVAALAKQAGFKGVMAFMDELQVTAEALSLRQVSDILFGLAASMMERKGHYGFFVSMPISTQAAMLAERKDIFDRLQRQKCFFDLSTAYTTSFPRQLWKEYARLFGLEKDGFSVVAPEVLDALGQIADTGRPDLGNGPRTVVSAFSRIAYLYDQRQSAYTVEDLVSDCLSGEITLGQNSKYAKAITEVLNKSFITDKLAPLFKVLAAYPDGMPTGLIDRLGYRHLLDEVTKAAYGEYILENANGYYLVCLRRSDLPKTSPLESAVKTFYRNYAVDPAHAAAAARGFMEAVLPLIFKAKDGMFGFQSTEGKAWSWIVGKDRSSKNQELYHTILLTGAFEDYPEYPARLVRLNVCVNDVAGLAPQADEHMAMTFVLQTRPDRKVASVLNTQKWHAGIYLDLLEPLKGYRLPALATEVIPAKDMTPLFLLSLVAFLKDKADLPKTQEKETNFLVGDVLRNVTFSMFGDGLLDVHSADIHLSSRGAKLVADLFWHICRLRYPEYRTLITQPQWQKKIAEYSRALGQDGITLSIARGNEPFDPDPEANRDQKRQRLASVFGVGAASLESWGNGVRDLLDMSRAKSEGTVLFRVHPLEQQLMDLIKECPNEKRIKANSKMCQAVELGLAIDTCKELGYTDDEIIAVAQVLGPARRFFQGMMVGGKAFIYYEPVATEELQEELTGKLSSLRDRLTNLSRLSGFRLGDFPFEDCEASVAKLMGQEEYEHIKQQIHGHFEKVNRWIGLQFSIEADNLDKLASEHQKARQQLEASGALGLLSQKLEGTAAWMPEITQLQAQVYSANKKLASEWEAERKAIGSLVAHGRQWAQPDHVKEIAVSGDTELCQYTDQVMQVSEKVSEHATRFGTLKQDAVAFREWHQLMDASDATWDLILAFDPSGSGDLAKKFRTLADQVKTQLKALGREALTSAEAFLTEVKSLQSEAEKRRAEARRGFNVKRDVLLGYAKQVSTRVSVLRSQYNETDPNGSYTNLYDEVGEVIGQAVGELVGEFAQLVSDLKYAADYLDKGQTIERLGLLGEAVDGLNRTRVRTQVSISNEAEAKTLVDELCKMRQEHSGILVEYRKSVLSPLGPDAQENELLALLDKTDKDLKEVILALSSRREGIELGRILDMLSSLFRKNQLSIKVRKSS